VGARFVGPLTRGICIVHLGLECGGIWVDYRLCLGLNGARGI
jgi:hypothetical protein